MVGWSLTSLRGDRSGTDAMSPHPRGPSPSRSLPARAAAAAVHRQAEPPHPLQPQAQPQGGGGAGGGVRLCADTLPSLPIYDPLSVKGFQYRIQNTRQGVFLEAHG